MIFLGSIYEVIVNGDGWEDATKDAVPVDPFLLTYGASLLNFILAVLPILYRFIGVKALCPASIISSMLSPSTFSEDWMSREIATAISPSIDLEFRRGERASHDEDEI